jgi:uncharacterized Zn finger protein
MSALTITEATILHYASAETFQLGRKCYQQGAVIAPVLYGTKLLAEVKEASASAFVCCTFQADGAIAATCTCQNAWGGWCKHMVAACLALLHHPKNVEQHPALERTLEHFTRDELQAFVVQLAEHVPHLAEAIDKEAASRQPALSQPQNTSTVSAKPLRTKVDTKAVRRQIRSAIHSLDRMRSSEAYWHVGSVVREVGAIADQALELLKVGDGRGALAALKAVTEVYLAEWVNLDDSDGYASDLFHRLGPLWAEALLSTELSQKERNDWVAKLAKWQREVGAYGVDEAFVIAIDAALQGWEGQAQQHVGITDEGEVVWHEETPVYARELAKIKLAILERQGRLQEYLALAKSEGQTSAYLTMLVRLDRPQEAVEYGRAHLAAQEETLDFARALCEHGEREESLQIAHHGLTLEGRRAELAVWLRDQAEAMGRQELALGAAEQAFRAQMNLANYRHAARLAGQQWALRKTVLLEYARTTQVYEIQGKIDVFLHEGLIDDAIAALDSSAGHTMIGKVVDVAIQKRPEWAIQASKKQAEFIMNGGKAQYYQSAANWLSKVHQAYQVLNRNEEWQVYLNELLQLHRLKHKLVPLLKAIK